MKTKGYQIVTRIERLGPGKTFSAKDFLDLASRTMIDVTLAKLAQSGQIRRVRRGLYDVPKINPALGGKLSPDIDEAARAIARRQRWKIVPEGTWAANLLGLSTQVPSKIVYLTDGPNKCRSDAAPFNSNMPGRRPWQGSMANSRLWCKRCGISAKRVLARARLKRSARRYRQRKSASL